MASHNDVNGDSNHHMTIPDKLEHDINGGSSSSAHSEHATLLSSFPLHLADAAKSTSSAALEASLSSLSPSVFNDTLTKSRFEAPTRNSLALSADNDGSSSYWSITPPNAGDDHSNGAGSLSVLHNSDYTIPTSNQRRRLRQLSISSAQDGSHNATSSNSSPPSSVAFAPLLGTSARRMIFPHLKRHSHIWSRSSTTSSVSAGTTHSSSISTSATARATLQQSSTLANYGSLDAETSHELVPNHPPEASDKHGSAPALTKSDLLVNSDAAMAIEPNIAWYAMIADGVWAPAAAPPASRSIPGQPPLLQHDGLSKPDTERESLTSSPFTLTWDQSSFHSKKPLTIAAIASNSVLPASAATTTRTATTTTSNANALGRYYHAQSLLLGMAMAALWTSSNLMAPNLTVIAADFGYGMQNAQERDMYFGSILSLVTTVASIPLATAIGLATDNVVPTRPTLLVCVLLAGAISTLGTGQATQYWHVVLTRWLSGGAMAGSIPVAFSLVSDWFDVSGRNVACSGVTACMGLGVIAGQVYAGAVSATSSKGSGESGDGSGHSVSWAHAFTVSAILQTIAAILCAQFIHEPVRGGTELAFQAMMKAGIKVLPPVPPKEMTKPATSRRGGIGSNSERRLSFNSRRQAATASMSSYLLCHGPNSNATNSILLWQGFFSSVPWGVMFVFLNDFLLQERGFSESDATFLVAMFGVGCAAGGIVGGAVGHVLQPIHKGCWVPLFMSVTTLLGIFPFLGLLNSNFTNAHGVKGILYAGLGGMIASLPSVLVRPCLMNVNPPATRGRALTTANLLICLGRGIGPCCIPLIQHICHLVHHRLQQGLGEGVGDDEVGSIEVDVAGSDRKFAFNFTLVAFWSISAAQLLLLVKTLPRDQDAMEAELAQYAAHAMQSHVPANEPLMSLSTTPPLVSSHPMYGRENGNGSLECYEDEVPLTTIAERMTSFDDIAAKETLMYVQAGIKELSPFRCRDRRSLDDGGLSSRNSEVDLDDENDGDILAR